MRSPATPLIREDMNMDENSLSKDIIGAAIEVHKLLGQGLLESAYSGALAYEFDLRNIAYEKEKPLPIYYKGKKLEIGFRADFLVGGLVIVEIKAVSAFTNEHAGQIMNYLKLSGCRLGLLLNFHAPQLRLGLRRIVNNLIEPETLS